MPQAKDKRFSPLPSPLQNSQDLQPNVKGIIPEVPYLQEFQHEACSSGRMVRRPKKLISLELKLKLKANFSLAISNCLAKDRKADFDYEHRISQSN